MRALSFSRTMWPSTPSVWMITSGLPAWSAATSPTMSVTTVVESVAHAASASSAASRKKRFKEASSVGSDEASLAGSHGKSSRRGLGIGRPANPEGVAEALELYRARWQIELCFKRLKSLFGLGHVPKRSDASARAWIEGKLLTALLIERLIDEAKLFSPWGFEIAPPQSLEGVPGGA